MTAVGHTLRQAQKGGKTLHTKTVIGDTRSEVSKTKTRAGRRSAPSTVVSRPSENRYCQRIAHTATKACNAERSHEQMPRNACRSNIRNHAPRGLPLPSAVRDASRLRRDGSSVGSSGQRIVLLAQRGPTGDCSWVALVAWS